jgi:3-hydroxyisobutyrate dehydrogenase
VERVGFIGLGLMGEVMALNLVRAGVELTVWNRTPSKTASLRAAGAAVAAGSDEVFTSCGVVFTMLSDEAATVEIVERACRAPDRSTAGVIVVQLGTISPACSRRLHRQLVAAGGRYVEAPVSGSREPARRAELVAMVAGDLADVEAVRPLLKLLCAHVIGCGAVPAAAIMKLAVNAFLITMVTGLAEAVAFAAAVGVDLATFAHIVDCGPMSSVVSRRKLAKLTDGDQEAEAAAREVLRISEVHLGSAADAGVAAPLMQVCRDLLRETVAAGDGVADMVAVADAISRRAVRRTS